MLRVWIGNTVRVRVDFTDDAGAPVAATGVAITARDPNGQRVAGAVNALPETGAFYADFPLLIADAWYVRAECAGPAPAAVEDRIDVIASNI